MNRNDNDDRGSRLARPALLLFLGLLASGCGDDGPATPGGEAPSEGPGPTDAPDDLPPRGPFVFVDATEGSGLAGFVQIQDELDKPLILGSIGAGVGLFDYDQDGDLDAWLVNGDRLERASGTAAPRDAVFANDGGGRFTDATEALGVVEEGFSSGVRLADVDGDGWRDAYVSNWGPNAFFRNVEGQRFEEEAAARGLDEASWSTGAAFFDADRDGDLDLYLAAYVDFDADWIRANRPSEEYRGVKVHFGPRGLPGAADRFFRNDGNAVFTDVSEAVGVVGADAFGFQAVVLDADEDGWLDVYVANDSVPNYLWRNVEGESFEDVAFLSGAALSMNGTNQAGMGVAVGDWDGDLDPDLYVTNFAEDYFTLYRNDGGGIFSDVTRKLQQVASTNPYLGWGCGIFDFDGDGDHDVYAANGHVYPQVDQFPLGTRYRQKSLLFENLGDGTFGDPDRVGGPGFAVERSTRGSAVGDLDGDGDLDVLLGNMDEPPTLLRNDTPGAANGVHVRLVGRAPNTEAVGAKVVGVVERDGAAHRILQLVGTSGSFLSSDAPGLFFGLGGAESLQRLEITWPDGETEVQGPFESGARVTLEQR